VWAFEFVISLVALNVIGLVVWMDAVERRRDRCTSARSTPDRWSP
jgi:hypothetical protein